MEPLTKYINYIINNILNNSDISFKFQYLFLQYIMSYYIVKLISCVDEDDDEEYKNIGTYIYDFFNFIGHDFIGKSDLYDYTNISYDSNLNIITRIKDSEKIKITNMLKDMSKEQRKVDDEFKRYGIGFWSKGKEKGLRVHQNDKYDNDRLDEFTDTDDFMRSLHGDIYDINNEIDDYEAIDMEYIGDDDDGINYN